MNELLVGYARVSTEQQDLTSQRNGLHALGVGDDRIYVDHGLRLLFNVLAMVAEFEADLIRMRTREGMKIAKAKGRLRGKQPKLKLNQAKHLLELHDLGTYTQAELAELFGVGRSTVYRTIERMRPKPPEPKRPFAHLANPQG
jgi:DNA invertase Pin-like site-specific DNA recombinase